MPTIAIGDIHGHLTALDEVLEQVTRDLRVGDTLVFLGDYIDRGPATRACIERIIELRSKSKAQVVTLLGNHEEWLLRTMRDPTRHSWLLGMEAFDTIASYSSEAAIELRRRAEEAGTDLIMGRTALPYDVFFSHLPAAHVEFFESLAPYHRNADGLCAHGGLDPTVPTLDAQPMRCFVWGSDHFPDSYSGDEPVVYGHWDNSVLDAGGWPWPRVRGQTIGIDTISHGVLTAVRLPDRKVFQSLRQRTTSRA